MFLNGNKVKREAQNIRLRLLLYLFSSLLSWTLLTPYCVQAKEITVELVWQFPEVSWLEIEPAQGDYLLKYDNQTVSLSPGKSMKLGRSSMENFLLMGDKMILLNDTEIILTARDSGIIRIRQPQGDWRSYRGNLTAKNNGYIWKIYNTLDQEAYLKGVVPIEMSNAWAAKGFEALKAQAVAARTYMLKNSNNGMITDSPDIHQAYLGNSAEGEASRAVTATTGEILTDKDSGIPISIFYSSHNGGYTEETQNVWQNHDSHYRAFPDPFSNGIGGFTDKWTFVIAADALGQAFDLAPIRKLELEKYPSGRVYRVTLMDWLGNEKTVTGGEFVRTFYPQDEPLSKYSFLGRLFQVAYYFPPVEQDSLYKQTLSGGKLNSADKRLTGPLLTRIVSSNDGISAKPCAYGSFVFNGRGWGHGVGMSQWGAYHMAMEGYSYRDILTYYYKNSTVIKTGS